MIIKKEIEETNLSKFEAYACINAGESVKASDYTDTPFTIKGYVICKVEAEDSSNGRSTYKTITIATTDNVVIGSKSTSIIDTIDEIQDLMMDEGLTWQDIKVVIHKIPCKKGMFLKLDVVL